LYISGESQTIPAYIIKKVTKPTFTVSEVKHSFINHSFYYPGRIEYNEIEFTLVDPINEQAAKVMRDIITESGYVLPDSMDTGSPQTMTKRKSTKALGEIKIAQIDGEGEEVEVWTLWSAWVKEISYGDLDYESDDLSEITVKIRYDWAQLESTYTPPPAT
jgi:glutamate 5-kinase